MSLSLAIQAALVAVTALLIWLHRNRTPAKARSRSHDQRSERGFWASTLLPVVTLDGPELDKALVRLSKQALRHPTYGRRRFPAGYLRTKLLALQERARTPGTGPNAAPTPVVQPAAPAAAPAMSFVDELLDRTQTRVDTSILWMPVEFSGGGHSDPAQPLIESLGERNALLVTSDATSLADTSERLAAQGFSVDTAASATDALDYVFRTKYLLLLVAYPLSDIDLRSFLSAVRDEQSPCRSSALLLLVSGEDRDSAQAFVGHGANQIIAPSASPAELQSAVTALVKVATRNAAKFTARLVPLGETVESLFCQTADVSSTGMLVHTDRLFPIGTDCQFELTVPGQAMPFKGVARVARHATERDKVEGIGVRFTSFDGNSREKFEMHLLRMLAPRVHSESRRLQPQ